MNKVCYTSFKVRILLLISLLFLSVNVFADGFTPTEGGLVVDLKPGDRFLLSVIVDEDGNPATTTDSVEYFVCDYEGSTGGSGIFSYNTGHSL